MRSFIAVGLFVLLVAATFTFFQTFGRDVTSNPNVSIVKTDGIRVVKPLDLNGKWKSAKPNVTAIVKDGTIEVESTTEDGGSVRWWYGTFDNPQDGKTGVTSKGITDVNKLYLSSAETKDFVYHDGQLKFTIAVMGTTKVIEMKRV